MISNHCLAENYKICLTGTTVKSFPKYGEAFFNGADLAAKAHKQITLHRYYYDRTAIAPLKTYKKMVGDGCHFIIGFSTGNDLIAIDQISRELKVPVLSIYGDSSELIESNPFVSTMQPDPNYLIKPLLNKIYTKIRAFKKALVITAIDRESMLNYKIAYKDALSSLGIDTIEIDLLEKTQGLSKVKQIISDKVKYDFVVLLTRSSLGAKIIDLLAKVNGQKIILGTKYFGSSSLPAFLKFLEDKNIEAYFSRHNCLCDKTQSFKQFVLSYEKEFKVPPMVISASSYDIVKYVIASLDSPGATKLQKIMNTKYNGVTGVTFKKKMKVIPSRSFQMKITKDGYAEI